MKKKLKSQSGETLVETLVAMLVISVSSVMLAGSIVTAARVNKNAKNLNVNFNLENVEIVNDVKVKVQHQSGSPTIITGEKLSAYKTADNVYFFYEVK